jgi:hypothetical protein
LRGSQTGRSMSQAYGEASVKNGWHES